MSLRLPPSYLRQGAQPPLAHPPLAYKYHPVAHQSAAQSYWVHCLQSCSAARYDQACRELCGQQVSLWRQPWQAAQPYGPPQFYDNIHRR